MKLDPVFTVKENKLFNIADDSAVSLDSLHRVELIWSTVELEPESYNEEFLANLREELKVLEGKKEFAVLVPVVDKPLDSPDQIELFINAFNHAARRVKDCASVAGFELPAELASAGFDENSPAVSFMETVAIKHAQYVYFFHGENAPKNTVVLF